MILPCFVCSEKETSDAVYLSVIRLSSDRFFRFQRTATAVPVIAAYNPAARQALSAVFRPVPIERFRPKPSMLQELPSIQIS